MLAASTLEVLKKTLLSILLFFDYYKERYSSSSRTLGMISKRTKFNAPEETKM
jgi:hypothetical protein